jgi:hypothetical protein
MSADVLAYADKRHWEALKAAAYNACDGLRNGQRHLSKWERNHLADTIDNLADYTAVLRSQLVTATLERRQSEGEGAR